MSALVLSAVAASYGGSQALSDVSLEVAPGEVVALLGRNGMGKSTTIKTILGLLPIKSGDVTFGAVRLNGMASHRIARLGIGLVPEGRRCFGALSVEENLLAAARPGHWNFDRVGAVFPRLSQRKGQNAASLSGGEQQMLAIGRALMTNPKLLILDEATEGLAPLVRKEIWDALAALKRENGLSLLVVDKSLKELSHVADRAVILKRGESVWSGDIAAVDEAVTQIYLGV